MALSGSYQDEHPIRVQEETLGNYETSEDLMA
jgi:hypothetical protein